MRTALAFAAGLVAAVVVVAVVDRVLNPEEYRTPSPFLESRPC